MKNRIFFVALALLLPLSGWAQFTFTTNNGAITITGYTGSGGNVTIPSATNGWPVTSIGAFAFLGQDYVVGMTIPDNITSIGEGAFEHCNYMTTVTIGHSVTSIGDQAFRGCNGLTSVTIPASVTNIGDGTFDGCGGMQAIVVNTANPIYASVGGVLFNKALTTLIQYPERLTGSYAIPASVNSIGEKAFYYCDRLTSVTIPDCVTCIGNDAFYYCAMLTNMTIPNNVTNIGAGAFQCCSKLTNITVNVANPSFTSAGGVLFNKALTTLIKFPEGYAGSSYVIPDGVTNIGDWAFCYCGLMSVTIPASVISIGNEAFYYCSLTSATVPNSVTSIGDYAFAFCYNLHQVYFAGNAPSDAIFNTWLFYGESGTAYYVPGMTGWGGTFGGWPTAGWYQPRPQILGTDHGLGTQRYAFVFTISWATNTSVLVEASTNLQNWMPVITNTLANGTNIFADLAWTNYPQRFYRVRSN